MKGHVPTPDALAERMVRDLFDDTPPTSDSRILYPGSGTGPFAAAVERICNAEGWPLPDGLGVELDPERLTTARERDLAHVEFRQADFLAPIDDLDLGTFTHIIGNPPYVPIEGLDDDEKSAYRSRFDTAVGRFDLYLLFFERALDLLAPDGRLVFITPEKFEYVDTATPLRRRLTAEPFHVAALTHIDADAFPGYITFPCITTVAHGAQGPTTVQQRDGTTHTVALPTDGSSWATHVRDFDAAAMETGATLADVTQRISPGMATGADALFVTTESEVPQQLHPDWTRPTISGKSLAANDGPDSDKLFICPYRDDGSLTPEDALGAFGQWAELHRERLEDRSCVTTNGKAWYAWHETPPMQDLLQPKIVWRDITTEPQFWADRTGEIVPKHTVYYTIPKEGIGLDQLLEYLNSPQVRAWLEANCQKASNGYLRLQSRVLADLPVPADWAETYQATL